MSLMYRALFLLALISSGECHRVASTARQSASIDKIAEKVVAKFSVGSEWFQGGNEVCRSPEIEDSDKMLKRWDDKQKKLRALANGILAKNCYATCLLDHKALGQRMKMWNSCFKVQEEMKEQQNKDTPIFDKLMGPASDDDSLLGIMTDVQRKMVTWMQNRNYFQDFEDLPECHVDVSAVDLNAALDYAHEKVAHVRLFNDTSAEYQMSYSNAVAAQAIDKVNQQLYGPGCTRKMVRDYSSRVSGGEALIRYEGRLREAIQKMKISALEGNSPVDAAHSAMETILPESDLEALTSEVPSDSDDLEAVEEVVLLQTDVQQEEDSSEGESTGVGLLIFFIVVAFLVFLFVCFRGYFSFSNGRGGMSFSGGASSSGKCW